MVQFVFEVSFLRFDLSVSLVNCKFVSSLKLTNLFAISTKSSFKEEKEKPKVPFWDIFPFYDLKG